MTMQVIFINGLPRSGKDTFIQMVTDLGKSVGLKILSRSSIDPVRSCLFDLGIDINNKTPELRAAMSEIGDSLERNFGYRSKWCLKETHEAVKYDADLLFIQMREPDLIDKAADFIEGAGFNTTKLFMQSIHAEAVKSNPSDQNVWVDSFYDTVLSNDDGLPELHMLALEFLKECLKDSNPLAFETLNLS